MKIRFYTWYDWYRIDRQTTSSTAKAKPNGYEFDGLISLEYTLAQHITPMANIQYIQAYVNEYSENGSGFNDLKIDHQKVKSLSTILGAFADYTWKKLTTTVDLAWQREYLNHSRTLHYSTQTSSNSLEVGGAKRSTLSAGIDLLWGLSEKGSLEASYDLQWNSRFSSNRFYLGYLSKF